MANTYATSALKLSDTYVNTLPYNECSTAAATQIKDVLAGDFALEIGAMVVVKFKFTNEAIEPKLSVSNTAAKEIRYNGTAIPAGYLKANKTYQFIYDGTYWQLIGDAGKADENHTHNDVYYTETEVNSKLDTLSANIPTIKDSSGTIFKTVTFEFDESTSTLNIKTE